MIGIPKLSSPCSIFSISPTITTQERLLMSGNYRERYKNGTLNLKGSATYNSNNDVRGHIKSTAKFDVDDRWRWGFKINRI